MGVTFYHQVRADGGRRTGLSIDGSAAIENFVEPASAARTVAAKWSFLVRRHFQHPARSRPTSVPRGRA